MRKTLLSIILVLCAVFAQAQAPSFSWATAVSTPGADNIMAVAADASGHIYTCGHFSASFDFDPGAGVRSLTALGVKDMFVAKYDTAGKLLWAKGFGGRLDDLLTSMKLDPFGNILLSGYFTDSVDFDPGVGTHVLHSHVSNAINGFVLKLDTNGNYVWARAFGNAVVPIGIETDGQGNCYSYGNFTLTGDYDPGPDSMKFSPRGLSDTYFMKLDSGGNFVWAKHIGGTSYDAVLGLAFDGQAHLYASGFYRSTVDFDPGPSVFNMGGGSVSSDNMFLLKLDTAGNFVWVKSPSGSSYTSGGFVSADPQHVCVAASFMGIIDFDPGAGTTQLISNGSVDIALTKFDAGGNLVWAKGIGGSGIDVMTSISQDSANRLLATGVFQSSVDFDPNAGIATVSSNGMSDAFVLKLDTAGSFYWVSSFGGLQDDAARGLAADARSNLYVTGEFHGVVDFDPGAGTNTLSSNGQADGYMLKLGSSAPGVSVPGMPARADELKLYPNPAASSVTITSSKLLHAIRISSMNGQTLSFRNGLSGSQYTAGLKDYTPGIYLIEATASDGAMMRQKLIIR